MARAISDESAESSRLEVNFSLPYCPECGGEIQTSEKFCFYCGKKLPTVKVLNTDGSLKTSTESSSPSEKILRTIAIPQETSSEENEEVSDSDDEYDSYALRKLKLFSVMEVIGLGLVSILPLIAGFGTVASMMSLPFDFANFTSSIGKLSVELMVLLGVGAIFGMFATLQIREAFDTLSQVSDDFSTPRILSGVLLAGLTLFFLATVGLTLGLLMTYKAAAVGFNVGNAAGSVLVSDFWFVVFATLIGLIPWMVGGFGVVLGLWKIGDRYGQGVFKIAAILEAIPYMYLVAPILVFAGAQEAKR